MGQVPEDSSYSFFKPIPKPIKDNSKLNGYNAEYHEKADGTERGQEAC